MAESSVVGQAIVHDGSDGTIAVGSYYANANKLDILRDLFGEDEISIDSAGLRVGNRTFPIIDDVIVLIHPSHYPPAVRQRLARDVDEVAEGPEVARDIQFTFGEEWTAFDTILPEHQAEFDQYFDLVDVDRLRNLRICDLGCGNGRWSRFLAGACRELVLVDFSDGIFVARRTLRDAPNCLFFMADLRTMPFRLRFADFVFSIGVLHHLPTPCLDEVRALKQWAPECLVYLYYALDNRPWYFRMLLPIVTIIRLQLARIRGARLRKRIASIGAVVLYLPLIYLGEVLQPFGLSRFVPLYEFYRGKSRKRIEQDVYDRFFTRIEQRVTRLQILELRDTFSYIRVSPGQPYWHFVGAVDEPRLFRRDEE